MEFVPVRDKEFGLLTEQELKGFKELINRGRALLNELRKPSTYNRLRKFIMKFANAVNAKRSMLERVIERSLSKSPGLSIHVNQVIKNTQELILVLKQARVIDQYFDPLINRLQKLMAKYKVFIKPRMSVAFRHGKTMIDRNKFVISFDDLSIARVISLVMSLYEQEVLSNFLLTEANVIESGIVVDFITGVNKEELKLAINEDPKHSEFLLKAYVVLNYQVKEINRLVELMNKYSVVNEESTLNTNLVLFDKELKKVAAKLVESLSLLSKARDQKVVTERLISLYNETELLRDAYELIKSYLRYKFKVSDLLDQIRFDYLSIYEAVTPELEKYNEFKNRSKYLFLKNFWG